METIKNLGIGALHGIGFVLGFLFTISYACNYLGMNELSLAFGGLGLMTGKYARPWLAAVVFGAFCAWVGLDPTRDLVASSVLAGIIFGAGGLFTYLYWTWWRTRGRFGDRRSHMF